MGKDFWDAWVLLKHCDASMICKLHVMILKLLPVNIPPVLHASLSLQSRDNDDDRDPLLTDPSIKSVVGPSESVRGSSAVHAVHQKADAIRPRAHKLMQQALQLSFRLCRQHRAFSPFIKTCSIKKDESLTGNFNRVAFRTRSVSCCFIGRLRELLLRDYIDD